VLPILNAAKSNLSPAANVNTTGGNDNSPLVFGPTIIAAVAVIGSVAALFFIKYPPTLCV